MLPFFVCTDPAAARALLMYRFHTLSAARAKASRLGYRGALYAWESTDTGEEATPADVILPSGEIIHIYCGFIEHHISADVAYAVWQYWRATGDDDFFTAAGAEIMLETARFWASRATAEDDRRYHIRGVIGPDEYHEAVDDNAYTNLMAGWNLQRGRETAKLIEERWPVAWAELSGRLGLTADEVETWSQIATGLVNGPDAEGGLIEQFAGYHKLEDVDLAAYEPRSMPMDMLLGHDRILQTKVIKQADVVMALCLLWDEFSPQVREANFRYYEPRTGHGSSLSPGVHALVAARLGNLGLAERYLRQTAAIDLDDQLANAAGGVHMAALGSLWQAVVFGFAGVELLDDRLVLCPRLPLRWRRLGIPICWRGRQLYFDLRNDPPSVEVSLESGDPLVLKQEGETDQRLTTAKPLCTDAFSRRWELREEAGE
jgi:trehalose/maltose hydrolase-like predicted phosphorylase